MPEYSPEQTRTNDKIPKYDILLSSDKENTSIYIANKELKIDNNTAMHIVHQRDNMPHGDGWGENFPPVVNHTSSAKARPHVDFEKAKKGDYEAAIRLINDLVKDDKIISIAKRYPNAIIAYIHGRESEDVNMIPAAYASKFEALGLEVNHNIHAINKVSHTFASDIERICRRMRFEGKVEPARDYILLDDFITSGAELRDLKDYINDKGGRVVMFTTLGHGSFGKLTNIGIDNNYKNKLKESGITDQDLQKYGIARSIDCLTLSEAAKLYRTVNTRRERESGEVRLGLHFLRQRNTTIAETENQIQECEEQNEKPEQTIRRSGFRR